MTKSAAVALIIALSACSSALPTQTPTPDPTAQGSNSPIVHECDSAKPGWIFCDDFETNRLASYFEYNNPDSSFQLTDSVGVDGSAGMRVHFRKGQVDAGSLRLAFGRTPTPYMHPVDSGTAKYRDIYWRVYVRDESTWTGGGGDKLSRAQVLASPTWAQAMGAPVWSGGASTAGGANYLVLDPYSGTNADGSLQTTTYNDFPNLRWLGAVSSSTPIFDQSHVGKWYCVEAHARLNDAGSSNGVFELWIDGHLEAQHADLNWVGSFADYGINTVFLENYWNAGSPVDQYRYMDNFVVSTQRIGC
ncbi:MAG: hypothetical protein ABI035_07580 [Gemmatimonadaceae bacterium]